MGMHDHVEYRFCTIELNKHRVKLDHSTLKSRLGQTLGAIMVHTYSRNVAHAMMSRIQKPELLELRVNTS